MNKSGISPVQIGIILLTVATAVVHLSLGIPSMLLMFILNGLGYLGLLAAYFLPQFKKYRGLVRWALILFAVATIIGWIAVGERSTRGDVDKAIEVVLLVLLFIDMRAKES